METIYACSILSAPPLSKASALHTTRHGVVIIGCIGLQLSFPGSAIIQAIAIAPTYRGQGIGSRLLWQSIETFSLTHLVVETGRDAIEFYRMCRFTISSLGEKYPATERFLC